MTDAQGSIDALVLSRLTRVFGDRKALELIAAIRKESGLSTLTAWNDLETFAGYLQRRGGLEGAVGAVLGVDATLIRYARPARDDG